MDSIRYFSKSESENLSQLINLPRGARVSVFGCDSSMQERLQTWYRTSDRWEEDSMFALIGNHDEWLSRAIEATEKQVEYGLILPSAITFFAERLVFCGAQPLIGNAREPKFIIELGDKGEFCVGLIRLAFSLCENALREELSGIDADITPLERLLAKPDDWSRIVEFVVKTQTNGADGLTKSLGALILLLSKEEKRIKRDECVVLLASKLIKVYNIFVEYLPRVVFAPDNGARCDAIKEFLGCEPTIRKIKSEYEIQKRYYLLSKRKNKLLEIIVLTQRIIDFARDEYERTREDFGFCYGPDSEDIKFAIFLASDVINGETMLDFIKDCGIADAHI